jgi:uncharacterized protein YjbI with pentapeptide repeats
VSNEEHLEILKQGVDAWNKWREENLDIRPDLSEAYLSRADLRGANLTGADLRNADLSRAVLVRAHLGYADLRVAHLGAANLIKANLRETNLTGADLHGANLYGANLYKANPSGAHLREANLIEADLREANLYGADLYRADLSEANLSRANLSGVDLREAYLSEADLSAANLSEAYLSRADLREANLSRTYLSGADLRGANLSEAYLRGADLRGVDLSKVSLVETFFVNIDLSDVKGLDKVNHYGPSSIGTDTLERSKGKIPKVFLRGCGLSDWQIEAAKIYRPNFTPQELTDITYKIHELRYAKPIQYFSCFISYSHADKDFADCLFSQLQDRGIRCWLDEHQLLPGDDIRDQIDRGISLWDKTLLCCSEVALNSYWVSTEIDKTLKKEERLWQERGKKILTLIPLNLDGYLFQWNDSRASVLTDRHAEDLTDWKNDSTKLERAIERIEKALRADEGGREPPPLSRL